MSGLSCTVTLESSRVPSEIAILQYKASCEWTELYCHTRIFTVVTSEIAILHKASCEWTELYCHTRIFTGVTSEIAILHKASCEWTELYCQYSTAPDMKYFYWSLTHPL